MAIADKVLEVTKRLLKEVDTEKLLDIVTFAESKLGLGITLRPAQKFILKLFFMLSLSDDKNYNCIPVKDKFNEKLLYEFSEVEFFKFLYKEDRINISYGEYEELRASGFTYTEIIFLIGRRGSKTVMTSVLTSYMLYLLLNLEDPHKFFNILHSDDIGIALSSNRAAGAERQFLSLSTINSTVPKV